MLNLSQETIEQQEELIRQSINQLSDSDRKAYFHLVKPRIKDPDTYATLNWFFLAGLHHFYLGFWLRGCIHLSLFALGMILVFIGLIWVGVLILLSISIIELYALFQSQLIVQNYNNQMMRNAINEINALNT